MKNKWNFANRCVLINCIFFWAMAVLDNLFQPHSLALIYLTQAIFFCGSLLSFLLLLRANATLAPISWFVLGAGIYFGLGAIGGGLHLHTYSDLIFGSNTLYISHVNLLNSSSVLIVLSVALWVIKIGGKANLVQGDSSPPSYNVLVKVYPYVLAIATTGVILKYFFFPIAENLMVRSALGKMQLLTPAGFMLLGMLWPKINWPLRIFALIIFFFEIFNGVLTFSKYQVLCGMLALIMGVWARIFSYKLFFLLLSSLALTFIFINPIINKGRAHLAYDAQNNTISTRIEIIISNVKPHMNFDKTNESSISRDTQKNSQTLKEKYATFGRRLDVLSIQGYLLNEYNEGRSANTLSNFWMTFIPRIIWSQKPIMTQMGSELHKKYFNDPDQISSALAPTYSGEAYWNYGPAGVVLVSIMLGLVIGWLTNYSFLALLGIRPEYFLIAVPVAIWAWFVESWLVSSYLGEFVIFILILAGSRILIRGYINLKNKACQSSKILVDIN